MSVSKPLPHDTAHLHVTGAARYADDIPTPPGTLHLAFGQSKIAAGRFTARIWLLSARHPEWSR